MTNELTRLLSAGLDLLALKILGKDRAAQAQATAPTGPCVAVPPERRAQQKAEIFSTREPRPYQECLDTTDFAAVMRAHRGLETWPRSRRLEGVQRKLGWLPPAAIGLILTLWGPQEVGGHGKSTTMTLAPDAVPHPQAGIARNWLAEYAPEVLQ